MRIKISKIDSVREKIYEKNELNNNILEAFELLLDIYVSNISNSGVIINDPKIWERLNNIMKDNVVE